MLSFLFKMEKVRLIEMKGVNKMSKIKFHYGSDVPLEMDRVRSVVKINVLDVEELAKAMDEAGYNTCLLQNRDVFMDMLRDRGVKAMSDNQQAAMMNADDSYAGSATFTRLESKLEEVFG